MEGSMALPLGSRTPLCRAIAIGALGLPLLAPAVAGASVPAPAKATATVTATAAKAKVYPSVRSVRPMRLAVGDTLEIRGRHFLRGRNKNTVVFQRDGAKAIFVKARIGTTKLIKVTLPDRLSDYLVSQDGAPAPTRFRIRVLSARFGKRFTRNAGSPVVEPKAVAPAATEAPGPAPVPIAVIAPNAEPVPLAPPAANGDCDGNGVPNGAQADDDDDLLDDATENRLGLDSCKPDTDLDGVSDGYEYQSARDLNDDGFQSPDTYLPYPGKRPYPNPLDGRDATTDFDGDVLTLHEEYSLWVQFGDRGAGLGALSYSDGKQCTVPGLVAATYDKQAAFLAWAAAAGYASVWHNGEPQDPNPLALNAPGLYDLRDVNHDGVVRAAGGAGYLYSEARYFDFDRDGLLCDNERDEDADGLTNYDEAHGRTTSGYWAGVHGKETPFTITYADTNLVDPDSDGDGVRDGADDQDHDDIPNLAELSRSMATGDQPQGIAPRGMTPIPAPDPADGSQPQGRVNPFNPCLPSRVSRTCLRHPPLGAGAPAPFDASPNYEIYN
jgi:hypothetical protein